MHIVAEDREGTGDQAGRSVRVMARSTSRDVAREGAQAGGKLLPSRSVGQFGKHSGQFWESEHAWAALAGGLLGEIVDDPRRGAEPAFARAKDREEPRAGRGPERRKPFDR